MRFSASVLVALVGVAFAAPTSILPTGDSPVTGLLGGNDLVGELIGVVSQVENGLGVDDLEKKLDTLLGSIMTKVCFTDLYCFTCSKNNSFRGSSKN